MVGLRKDWIWITCASNGVRRALRLEVFRRHRVALEEASFRLPTAEHSSGSLLLLVHRAVSACECEERFTLNWSYLSRFWFFGFYGLS